MGIENKIAIIATCITIISMVFSIYYSQKASRKASLTLDFQKFEIHHAYKSELRSWSERVIEILSEASHIDLADKNSKNLLLSKLSAEIDKGRQFFPNLRTDQHGKWKESAYQGFRPETLDHLVNSYNLIDKQPESYQRKTWKLRKAFVSDIQEVIDPRATEAELNNLKK